MKAAAFGAVLVLAAVLLAPFASPLPDGLEKTAREQNFAGRGEGKAPVASLMAEYLFPGVGDRRAATVLAGLAGSAAAFVLALGAGYLFGKKGRGTGPGGER